MNLITKIKSIRYGIPHSIYIRYDGIEKEKIRKKFLKKYYLAVYHIASREEEDQIAFDIAKQCPVCHIDVIDYAKELLKQPGHKNIISLGSFVVYHDYVGQEHWYPLYYEKEEEDDLIMATVTYRYYKCNCPKCNKEYEVVFHLNDKKKEYKYPNER